MTGEPGAESNPAPNKRKRTAQACGPCRTKKTKCDGLRPTCTPCSCLGYACEYPLDSSAPNNARQVMVTKTYLEQLEARIMKLESGPQEESQPSSASANGISSATPVNTEAAVLQDDRRYPPESSFAQARLDAPPLPVSRQVPSQSAGIDGMGLLLAQGMSPVPKATATNEHEVYGEESGVSFHRLLLDALLPGYQLAPSTRELCPEPPPSGFLGLPPSDVPFTVVPNDLPTLAQATQMWEYFKNHTCQIYPFMDNARLQKSYEDLLQASITTPVLLENPKTQPVIALHFVIFALVQNLSPIHRTQSDVFHIALRLLRKHVDWPHSMVKVQVLLYGAMIMQGIDCPNYAWDLTGNAVRAAYAVGLHDPVISVDLHPAEREYRLRTWWACYIFDRLVTLSIARPSAVTLVIPTLPLPSQIPGQPPEKNVRFFEQTVRLNRALSDIIENPISSRGDDKLLERVVEDTYQLEKDYAVWADALPSDLGFGNLTPEHIDPLVVVLALRGHSMRLLLHRRVVTFAIRRHLGLAQYSSRGGANLQLLESQQRDIAFGISLAAVIETAVQTVHLLTIASESDVVLNAPWYLLFYAMNAFMSLIATFLLNLGHWSTFIKTPGTDIVHAFVRKLNDRYHRPTAAQALTAIEQLLGALGLPFQPAQREAAETARAEPADETTDLGAWFNNITDLASLPHLDLDELCRSLDLRFEDTWGDPSAAL